MSSIELSRQEAQVVLRSIENCLGTCHEGGLNAGCPDCSQLESVKKKLKGFSI